MTHPAQDVGNTPLVEHTPGGKTKYGTKSSPGGAPGTLANTLRMIERLPLTDGEKADAIRRLLAERRP